MNDLLTSTLTDDFMGGISLQDMGLENAFKKTRTEHLKKKPCNFQAWQEVVFCFEYLSFCRCLVDVFLEHQLSDLKMGFADGWDKVKKLKVHSGSIKN